MKDKLFNCGVENEKLYECVQEKCELVKEKEVKAAKYASPVDNLKLQIVNLQTKIEHQTTGLTLKCSLLDDQEENVINHITIKEAKELQLNYIEFQEGNDRLSKELHQKNDLLKENSEMEELKKKIVDLQKSHCKASVRDQKYQL